jgi:hypothetical protein
MKKLISICIASITFQVVAFTQCGINQMDLRDKYCKGSYLVHSELSNSSPSVEIALKEGNKYAIYLLNSSRPINRFTMLDSHNKSIALESRQNPNYTVYTFAPNVSDTYVFSVDFGTDKDACVLWTIYLQNENNLKAGIYKNFEEMKYNNPSGEFVYRVTTKSKKYNQDQLYLYSIDIDKRKARSIGKVFGFSDGKNVYINENSPSLGPSTEFVKVEFMDRYYYYENIQPIVIPTGTTVVTVLKLVQKVKDMNTGEVTILNNKSLKELIAGNPQLLNEYDNESQKNRKLKEYLIRYLNSKYNE